MSIADSVRNALCDWPDLTERQRSVLVPTHCLYPSNSIVVVSVEEAGSLFIVHDDGRAVDEFLASKEEGSLSLYGVEHIVRRQGLILRKNGRVEAPPTATDGLAAAIALVANVSKEVAHYFYDRFRMPSEPGLREQLALILQERFRDRVRREEAWAGLNKTHRFDFIVHLPQQRTLLIDAVGPDASSINAKTVAHFDVKVAELENVEQRIVYDDAKMWRAADLQILTVGATIVPISRASQVLQRLAA